MINNYVLPFSDKPLLSFHHNLAFFTSIIGANADLHGKDILPWAISKFINTSFDKTDKYVSYDLSLFDNWSEDEGILNHQTIKLDKSTFVRLKNDVIDYLINLISCGFYITGLYNEKYIPGKGFFKISDFLHDYILYGVSGNKFISAGYMNDNRFKSFEIPFLDFINSINNTSLNQVEFDLWTYNEKYDFIFNKERMIVELSDYLNSTSSHTTKPTILYGLKANNGLKEHLISCVNDDNNFINLVFTRAYMEHEYMLNSCVHYIHDKRITNISEHNINLMTDIYRKAIIIHRLGIKYNITKEKMLIDKISDLFDVNNSTEPKILANIH